MEVVLELSVLYSIQNKIGYKFTNPQLLEQAFTRRSFSQENSNFIDNEVLEFYGDSVVGLFVTKALFKNFGQIKDGQFFSSKDEGELTNLKARNVNKECLAHCISVLGFEKYLLLGKGDKKNKAWESKSVKEDLFEAIIGAVAVDSNWNWTQLDEVCASMLKMFDFDDDFISLLNEFCKEHNFLKPNFEIKENSFDISLKDEYKKFVSSVKIKELDKIFTGYASTKYGAQMHAAARAVTYFQIVDMKAAVGEPNPENAVSQLHELSQKDFIAEPKYSFEETYDENGNPIWKCSCDLEDFETLVEASDSSKKEAKRLVAFEVLNNLMDENFGEEIIL